MIDKQGYIIGLARLFAGNHNDSYELKETIWKLFKDLQRLGLFYKGAIFNADKSFDSSEARKMLWNRGVRPNIPDNKRSRKHAKRGRKRYFTRAVYKQQFVIERDFAWVDKFRTLLIRFERKDVYWLGFHYIAFTLINLRELLGEV